MPRGSGKAKVLIGSIPTSVEIARYAALLQPSYQREHWTWTPGAVKTYVPTAEQILAAIEGLSQDIGADKFLRAATGGLEVRFENGQKMLYVDAKLRGEKPNVT
jgi:hypothetical protein